MGLNLQPHRSAWERKTMPWHRGRSMVISPETSSGSSLPIPRMKSLKELEMTLCCGVFAQLHAMQLTQIKDHLPQRITSAQRLRTLKRGPVVVLAATTTLRLTRIARVTTIAAELLSHQILLRFRQRCFFRLCLSLFLMQLLCVLFLQFLKL